jgi:serine/threonine protein kinase
MTPSNEQSEPCLTLEQAVHKLVSAWTAWTKDSSPPHLSSLVDRLDDEEPIEECVAHLFSVDMNYRARNDMPFGLSDYLAIHDLAPVLSPGTAAVREVLFEEYCRLRSGISPVLGRHAWTRLCSRYPRYIDDIDHAVALARYQHLEFWTDDVLVPIGSQVSSGYELIRELGRGSTGVVWLAWDLRLSRHIALKLLSADAGSEKRLRHEAGVASIIHHPNVVSVNTIGKATVAGMPDYGSFLFIDQEVCGDQTEGAPRRKGMRVGVPLTKWTLRGDRLRRSPRKVAKLIADVAGGVQVAHVIATAVHRDIKPQNVLVTPKGRAMIADWGLSVSRERYVGEDALVAASGADVVDGVRCQGTPSFMSLDQSLDGQPKRAWDISAVGAVMFFALTGQPPYSPRMDATNARHDVITQVRTCEPAPFDGEEGQPLSWLARVRQSRRYRGDRPGEVPLTLRRICRRAMGPTAKNRARPQYASALELAEDLNAWLEGTVPPHVGEDFRGQKAWHWLVTNRLPLSLIIGFLVVIATALFVLQWQRADSRARVAEATAATAQADAHAKDQTARAAEEAKARAQATARAALAEAELVKQKAQTQQVAVASNLRGIEKGLDDLLPMLTRLAGDSPAAQAEVDHQIGRAYDDLGFQFVSVLSDSNAAPDASRLYGKAIPLLEHAVSLLRGIGPEHRSMLALVVNHLAWAKLHEGRTNDAYALAAEAHTIERAVLDELTRGSPQNPAISITRENVICYLADLARMRMENGDSKGGADAFVEVLAIASDQEVKVYRLTLIWNIGQAMFGDATTAKAKILEVVKPLLGVGPRLRERTPWALAGAGEKIANDPQSIVAALGLKLPSSEPLQRLGRLMVEVAAELAKDPTILSKDDPDREKVMAAMKRIREKSPVPVNP